MKNNDNVIDRRQEAEGWLWGGLGVLAFSMSLTATRASAPVLGSVVVGLGRAVGAATLAGLLLLIRRERLPERKYWAGLLSVAACVVVGFPLLSAMALRQVPASHASVVVGLSPAATAMFGAWRGRERPGALFWVAVAIGALSATIFVLGEGARGWGRADLLLAVAVVMVAWGYAEGGRLARELDGWRVICWALLASLPVSLPGLLLAASNGVHGTPRAWLGFGYVTVVSMFLGFFAWYRGLALGGISSVSQLQLAQPLLSVGWAALLLGEPISSRLAIASVIVVGSVALSRWSSRFRATPQRTGAAAG
jgi:drug/metabolite transporter (DMT)-like permease